MSKFSLSTLVTTTLLYLTVTSVSASTAGFSESEYTVETGNTLTVDATGSDFTTPSDGASLSLTWDPSVLRYISSNIDVATSPWDDIFVNFDNKDSGSLDSIFLVMYTTGSNTGSNFSLASFTFDVIGNVGDQTAINLGISPIVGLDYGFLDGVDSIANVNYVASQVQVVPLPTTIWLFGTGIIGLLSSKRFKQKKFA